MCDGIIKRCRNIFKLKIPKVCFSYIMFLVINNIYKKLLFFDARKKIFRAQSIALDSSAMYADRNYYTTD